MNISFASAITDLPVIIQGALGSALFAFLLYTGQKATKISWKYFQSNNKQRRHQALLDELAVLSAISAKDTTEQTLFGVVIIYRAARYFVKAALWLTLGFIFDSTIAVFGIIGYVGCAYHLLQSLRILQAVDEETRVNATTRIKEIEERLKSHKKLDES